MNRPRPASVTVSYSGGIGPSAFIAVVGGDAIRLCSCVNYGAWRPARCTNVWYLGSLDECLAFVHIDTTLQRGAPTLVAQVGTDWR